MDPIYSPGAELKLFCPLEYFIIFRLIFRLNNLIHFITFRLNREKGLKILPVYSVTTSSLNYFLKVFYLISLFFFFQFTSDLLSEVCKYLQR